MEEELEFTLSDGTIVNIDPSQDTRKIFTLKYPEGGGTSFTYDPFDANSIKFGIEKRSILAIAEYMRRLLQK